MPKLVDQIVRDNLVSDIGCLSNTIISTFPNVLDIETFTEEALMRPNGLSLSSQGREHVTLGI